MNGTAGSGARHPFLGFLVTGVPLVVPIYGVINEWPIVTLFGIIGWTFWIFILNELKPSQSGEPDAR